MHQVLQYVAAACRACKAFGFRLIDPPHAAAALSVTAGKPIASLAFHVCADVLAIGCGHKLYMWEYAAHGKLPVIGALRSLHCDGRGKCAVAAGRPAGCRCS